MLNQNILMELGKENMKSDIPAFIPGDTVEVGILIKEGKRERVQIFKGVVMKRQNGGISETFTVRKISNGIGVEKTLPLHSPKITEIKVIKRGKVRRANLSYLKGRVGKAAKIKERKAK
ncbi:50S ribosomal protein L19 [Clostridiaceae bacterium HSG29]|nr:50S ribosomal protein L19 [Clostridiaceae bacterium HSG29]